MCGFTVVRSGPIAAGRQVTFSLRPPLRHPCRFHVLVNGRELELGDHGGFRVHGVGGSGSVTITPGQPNVWGTITFVIECPGCSQTIECLMPGGSRPPDPPDPREDERREDRRLDEEEREQEREDDREDARTGFRFGVITIEVG